MIIVLTLFLLLFSLAYMTDVLINYRRYTLRADYPQYRVSLEECIKFCADIPECDFSGYRFDGKFRSKCQLFGYDEAKRPFKDAISGDLYCNPDSREKCE